MTQTTTEARPTGRPSPASAVFREGYVEADGFRIRYVEAGQGEPLVHIHGAGGLRLSAAHDLLSAQFHVLAFELPGFGGSPANERSASMADLARTMNLAITTTRPASCALTQSLSRPR